MAVTPIRALVQREKAVASLTRCREVSVRRGYPNYERPGVPGNIKVLERIQHPASLWDYLRAWRAAHAELSLIFPKSFDFRDFLSDEPTHESRDEARMEFERAYDDAVKYF